ncbi:DUF2844 domain-containing protein [Paraburkholderia saeva]|uniref:DUF2844 domain-containing protein n=1 Tax=Paraburkholderia saeva TaxID=2777537 RepID=A0A9N8RZM9_9BURK|nr:DUF2844 domain-containing protein [Paraburkholderia saeva]CAG4903540.1 hypothetical protein R70241_03104 [Paraburkholderia saeva]CAG4905384.1 hypothetical protein R52603_03307 [Paraburkholderia saeva]CAG4909278.1 hypothetical protein LMG31841_03850 [Paraburkholderia saeva]
MSKSSRLARVVTLTSLGLCCALTMTAPAEAGLGGSPMTPPAGASTSSRVVQGSSAVSRAASTASSASLSQSAPASYTVRETTFGSGTVVHEYVSSAGTVFGIAWQGPQMPDLADLLGSYFPQYVAAEQAARAALGRRGVSAVTQDTLVVRSGGHMGAFAGVAWLPQALPAGVSGQDIQ